MILVDFSQVAISNIFAQLGYIETSPKPPKLNLETGEVEEQDDTKKPVLDEPLIRHMVLKSLKSYNTKFGQKFGDLVICVDSKNYWRREIFPYYKHRRKKNRETSKIDWPMVFATLNKLRFELTEFMPYRVINVDRAEADDVIAVIAKREHTAENVLVMSGDKDFGQLQKYKNINQYAPIQKKFIDVDNPIEFLREHIMIGDEGDGVPNFKSPDNVFFVDGRQTSIRKADLARWVKEPKPENFCDLKMLRGWKRNQELIDLEFIPKDVQNSIIEEWDKPFKPSRKKMFDYFVEFGLVELLKSIGEF